MVVSLSLCDEPKPPRPSLLQTQRESAVGLVQPSEGQHSGILGLLVSSGSRVVQSISLLFPRDMRACRAVTRRPLLPSPSAARRGRVTFDLGPNRDGGPGPPGCDSLAGLPHVERAGLPHPRSPTFLPGSSCLDLGGNCPSDCVSLWVTVFLVSLSVGSRGSLKEQRRVFKGENVAVGEK